MTNIDRIVEKSILLGHNCSVKFFNDNNHIHFWKVPLGHILFPNSEVNILPFNQVYVHDLCTWVNYKLVNMYYKNVLFNSYKSPVCLSDSELYNCVNDFSNYLPKENKIYMLTYSFGFECYQQGNGWEFLIDYALLK